MKNVYERLGVSIIERGESFYQPLMPKIVADLEKKGVCMIVPAGQLFYINFMEKRVKTLSYKLALLLRASSGRRWAETSVCS